MITGKYNAAVYLRLSNDDDDYKEESQSITNQRNYIMDYIRKKDEFIIIDEYIDDGFSGSSFERPGFKKMIVDIENKRINCVIVKDQSRFGRNDLVPYYIKIYFSLKGVRFIAINTNIDTYDDNASGNKLIGLNSFMDTHYNEDISLKVKSTIYTKKKKGLHLGATAKYGYKKDPNDKYKIIIDEPAASVVRRIFKMCAEGYSIHMIARSLDNENIPIPSEYKKLNRGNKSTAYGKWCIRTIQEILKSEMYIGNMCQGVNKRVAVGIRKLVRVPKEKQIIVQDTHNPIIDIETFNLVQNIMERNSHRSVHTLNYLLKGFIYCKECGHTIGINKSGNGKGYIVCNYYRKHSKLNLCTSHSMPYDVLEKLVLKETRKVCKKANQNLISNSLKKNDKIFIRIKQLEKENKQLNEVICRSKVKEEVAYMDRLDGKITFDLYTSMCNKIKAENENNKKLLAENQNMIDELKGLNVNRDYELIVKEYLSLKNPNRKIISSILDKIVVDKDLNIEIIYKIKTPF